MSPEVNPDRSRQGIHHTEVLDRADVYNSLKRKTLSSPNDINRWFSFCNLEKGGRQWNPASKLIVTWQLTISRELWMSLPVIQLVAVTE